MTITICCWLLSLATAGVADLTTTAEFTRRGVPELNPIARPFVEGRGNRGEIVLGAMSGGLYLAIDRSLEPYRTIGLLTATLAHTAMAIRNVRIGSAQEMPPLIAPILIVRW
ncbi:MAG: hypothetical protein HY207_10040 [Nitrospirae bacterium]|nr:hypothetical protein [Nitrospirota bacterium]